MDNQISLNLTIGIKTGRFEIIFGHKKETDLIPLPKHYGNKYSDASLQSLLAENPDAPQWDETQEKCFIRKDKQNIHDTLLVINPSGYTVGRCQINESETRVEFKPEYTPEKEVISQLFERIREMGQDNNIKVIGNEKTIKNIVRMTSEFNSQGYKKMEKDGKTFYQITLYPQKDDKNTPVSCFPFPRCRSAKDQ